MRIKKFIAIKNLTSLKNLKQEKNTQTCSANSEHKHSKIERFSALKERIVSFVLSHNRQNSKDSAIVSCQ